MFYGNYFIARDLAESQKTVVKTSKFVFDYLKMWQ